MLPKLCRPLCSEDLAHHATHPSMGLCLVSSLFAEEAGGGGHGGARSLDPAALVATDTMAATALLLSVLCRSLRCSRCHQLVSLP